VKIKVRLNVALKHYSKDTILDLDVDERGIFIDRYWRKRFKDSKIDSCIEIINTKKQIKKVTEKEVS